jgi:hypothetical protein
VIVMQSCEVSLTFVCPRCGDPLPVPVVISLQMCECGAMHQTITVEPDPVEVEHHALLHVEGDS